MNEARHHKKEPFESETVNKTSIQKKDFNKDLQARYSFNKMLVSILSIKWGIRLFNILIKSSDGINRKGVNTEKIYIRSSSKGADIPLIIYKPVNIEGLLPIMLYFHGGAYATGSPEFTPWIENFIFTRPCIIVAPKYRKSLTAPYPAAFNDCYDTLLWIKKFGREIGGFQDKVILAGHSAGGGLAAAVALKNRNDKDIDIAFQLPLYPMLDYRQETESARLYTHVPVWNTKSNKLAWDLYLRDLKEKSLAISPYASPALNDNYADLPPAISFVGEYEPFRDENIRYMEALQQAGIPVRFRVFPRTYHAFDLLVPVAEVSKEAGKFLLEAYADFYDTYCLNKG